MELGLSLVTLQAPSLADFVRKTSANPARILGLKNKGHLGPGADADITVLDLAGQRAVLGMANGQLIMYRGHVCGRGGRFITTAAGAAFVREKGLEPIVVDLAGSRLTQGGQAREYVTEIMTQSTWRSAARLPPPAAPQDRAHPRFPLTLCSHLIHID